MLEVSILFIGTYIMGIVGGKAVQSGRVWLVRNNFFFSCLDSSQMAKYFTKTFGRDFPCNVHVCLLVFAQHLIFVMSASLLFFNCDILFPCWKH
jgi:hypothetical protein